MCVRVAAVSSVQQTGRTLVCENDGEPRGAKLSSARLLCFQSETLALSLAGGC